MHALILGSQAQATITVTPVTPYGAVNDTVYYATSDVAAENIDTGFTRYTFTVNFLEPEAASNVMYFDIDATTTALAPTAGQQIVASVWIANSNNGFSAVPIAYSGGAVCGTSSNCQAPLNGMYYAARFGDNNVTTALRIGIIPGDICTLYDAAPTGQCLSGQPITTGPITFSFYVSIAPDGTSLPAYASLGAEKDDLKVKFQTGEPSFSCPANMKDTYFPSDGAILFEAAKIGFTASSAPQASLLLVAKKDGTVTTSTPVNAINTSNNDIVQRVTAPSTVSIGGFSNTTTGADNVYEIAVSVIDTAGVIADFSSSCKLTGVQTADVQGFLRSGNCFIATASFNSPSAAPVEMLRNFRDRVLFQSDAGTAFVNWYYAWSPGAAEWLMERPLLRFPVLLLLIPVQIFAWLTLNPLAFVFVSILCAMGIVTSLILTYLKGEKA